MKEYVVIEDDRVVARYTSEDIELAQAIMDALREHPEVAVLLSTGMFVYNLIQQIRRI